MCCTLHTQKKLVLLAIFFSHFASRILWSTWSREELWATWRVPSTEFLFFLILSACKKVWVQVRLLNSSSCVLTLATIVIAIGLFLSRKGKEFVPFFTNYLFLGRGKLQHCALLLDIVVLDLNLMCQLQPLLEGF